MCLSGSLFALGELSEILQVEGVRALDRQTESSTPDLGRHDTEGAGNTEQNSVIVVLSQAVVHQEGTRAAIDVGPWVLDLAGGVEALWNLLVVRLDELDQVVVVNVVVREVELTHETRISLTEDGVAIAWDNLATLERDVDELTDILACPILTVLGLEVEQVIEALLVCETVQRTGQTVHTSRE